MAVYAPGDTPDLSAASAAGADPNLLMRLWNYINPVGSAQADTLARSPNPLNTPSPVPPALLGGGPPVPPALLGGGQPPAPMPPGAPTPPIPGGPGGSSGGGGASGSFTAQQPYGPQLPPPTNAPLSYGPQQSITPWFHSSNTPIAPNPIVGAPLPPVKGPAVAKGSNRPATKIPASATASVGKSPFVPVEAQNQDWSGGALARGGPRMMTALDLSSLFGRR
jgi:hypothetical protein